MVILDEVHSYDRYTGTLIDRLILELEKLNCTVIILSATLTSRRRGQIVSIPQDDNADQCPYPLMSGRCDGVSLEPIAAKPPEAKEIQVDFTQNEAASLQAIQVAEKGGAILWICNTVDAAQRQYKKFKNLLSHQIPLGLLHSRFPFWRREKIENEWMQRFGKSSETRCGSILVSTQIVEQSVDLDADFLVTELAPSDMLLQRLGRLWRHPRFNRPVSNPKLAIIEEKNNLNQLKMMGAKEIVKCLGDKAYVYAPYVLLRTLETWRMYETVKIPSQIRQLIESTYEDRADDPESWMALYEEWFGTDSAKAMTAQQNCNLWQPPLEDKEGIQTRLNEIPTIPLVLCRGMKEQSIEFIDGNTQKLTSDFKLSVAQAIHKNLVKVPKYCFEQIKSYTPFEEYLFGEQTIGVVDIDGTVRVTGLRPGFRFFYSDELGLVIEKTLKKDKA